MNTKWHVSWECSCRIYLVLRSAACRPNMAGWNHVSKNWILNSLRPLDWHIITTTPGMEMYKGFISYLLFWKLSWTSPTTVCRSYWNISFTIDIYLLEYKYLFNYTYEWNITKMIVFLTTRLHLLDDYSTWKLTVHVAYAVTHCKATVDSAASILGPQFNTSTAHADCLKTRQCGTIAENKKINRRSHLWLLCSVERAVWARGIVLKPHLDILKRHSNI